MSRWTTLTPDHLKAAGHGAIMDAAGTLAVGGIDPVAEALADAAQRVRRAVSTGNVLDADPAKVPNSLKAVAIRLALFGLMQRIGLPLSTDQSSTSRDDQSDLKRISDSRIKVESPDTPAASAEMQPTGHAVQGINVPRRQTGGHRTSGL